MVMGMGTRVGASGAGCAHASHAPRGTWITTPDDLTRFSIPSGHAVGAYACETLLHWLEAEGGTESFRIGAQKP